MKKYPYFGDKTPCNSS